MADKNWMNLGMAFPIIDKGSKKALKAMRGSLEKIGSQVDNIGSSQAFDKLMSGIDVRKLDNMVGKMNSLADAAADNLNLSSSLDSAYLSASISAEKLGARTNVSAKEIKKATGFFHDLQMDVGDLQKGYVELKKAGIDASKIGFKNFKEFAKFADVLGVSTESLGSELNALRNSYGFTDDDLQDFLDTMTATSKELGISGEVFGNLGTITQQLDDHFAKLNMNVSPEEFTKMAKQSVLLAGALHKTGVASGDVIGTTTDLATQLTEAQFQMQQLTTGAAGDLPDLLSKMGIGAQDFDTAISAMNKSPLDFMSFMSDKWKDMDEQQRKFLVTHTGLNKDLMWGISNYPKVADEIANIAKSTETATGASQKMAKAFRVNRTVQEQFTYANEKFEHSLIGLSKRQGTATKILKVQKEAHKKLFKTLEKGAAKDGAVGLISRAFLAWKVAGIQGVAIALDDFFKTSKGVDTFLKKHKTTIDGIRDAFGGFAKKLGFKGEKKALTGTLSDMKFELIGLAPAFLGLAAAVKMSGLGGAASGLFRMLGPLGPLGAIIGGFVLIDKRWEGGLEGFAKDAVKAAEKHLPKIFDQIKKKMPGWLERGGGIAGVFGAAFIRALDALSEKIGEVDWEKTGKKGAKLLAGAFTSAFDFVADVLRVAVTGASVEGDSELVGALGGVGRQMGMAMIDGMKGALGTMGDEVTADTTLTEKMIGAGKVLGGVFATGFGLRAAGGAMQAVPGLKTAGKLTGAAGRGLTGAATGVTKGVAMGARALVRAPLGKLGSYMETAAKGFRGRDALGRYAQGGTGAKGAGRAVKARFLASPIGRAGGAAAGAASRLAPMLKGLPGVAKVGFSGAAKAAAPLVKAGSKILGPLIGFYEYVKQGPDIVEGSFRGISAALEGNVKEATKGGEQTFKGFVKVLDGIFLGVPSMIHDAVIPPHMGSDLSTFYNDMVKDTAAHMEVMDKEWSSFPDTMTGLFSDVKLSMTGMFDDGMAAGKSFWESFSSAGKNVLGILSLSFDAFKYMVIHNVFGSLIRGVESAIIGLISPWQEMLRRNPKIAAVLGSTGQQLASMDLEAFRVSEKLGLTEEAAAKGARGLGGKAATLAGTGALSTPGGMMTAGLLEDVMGIPMKSALSIAEKQLEEQKATNKKLEKLARNNPPAGRANQPAID